MLFLFCDQYVVENYAVNICNFDFYDETMSACCGIRSSNLQVQSLVKLASSTSLNMSKELAVRDELADMLKGRGIALAACTYLFAFPVGP